MSDERNRISVDALLTAALMPELDPEPWRHFKNSHRRTATHINIAQVFDPRLQYSQNREDYEDA